MSNTDISPDYAANVTAQLERDYGQLLVNAQTLIDEARKLPEIVPDDDHTLSLHASMIERMRDTTARFKTFHATEKEPHLRAGQAVDGFFFGWWEKLARRKNTDKPGAADVLQARVNNEMNRRLTEERRKREAAAAAARAEENRLALERAEAQRKADEAAAAAARARKPENVEAHQARSLLEAAAAEQINAERMFAAQVADDARIDTLAKSADMVRARLDNAPMVTMRQVPVVLIDDVTKLDMAALWPHLKEDHILMALKAWAKTKSHKTPMAGATIKMVDEAVVR